MSTTEEQVQHTPGPWEAQFPDAESGAAMVEGPIIVGSEGQPVAEVLSVDLDDEPEGQFATADARLIAAAPDLLAACKAALPWAATALVYRDDPHPDAVTNHAEDLAGLLAAIAKAEGRVAATPTPESAE